MGRFLGVLTGLMPLKKSGIVYVILAGSSLFSIKGRTEIAMLVGVCLARAAHDFFKDFGFMVPENPKLSLACGAHGRPMGRFLASLEPNPCQGS